jgi:signal transduction histidine kinase
MDAELISALQATPLFQDWTRECFEGLAHGGVVELAPGERLIREGDPSEWFYVLLTGELRITKRIGDSEALLSTYKPGTFFGEPSILLDSPYVASAWALTSCRVFRLSAADFWSMLEACPKVNGRVLRSMAQRTLHMQAFRQGHEKLLSLGTLAAGLAHELNNPAAAIARSARGLHELVRELPSLAIDLCRQPVPAAQQGMISGLAAGAEDRRRTEAAPLDPLARSEEEERITEWLAARNVDDAARLAPTLLAAGLRPRRLAELLEPIPSATLPVVMRWIGAILRGVELAEEIEDASGRISDLVNAVKDYSYLDRAPMHEVDVHDGLESTLKILAHKIGPGIEIVREYDRTLPRITAYPGELNQVWTNLIDNAIDALGGPSGRGRITIRTSLDGDHVLVQVIDNGPGIPRPLQIRIWEPFFTTKPVGRGMGLGLDISRRIVGGRHHGHLSVWSLPGDTRFRARLPIRPPAHLDPAHAGPEAEHPLVDTLPEDRILTGTYIDSAGRASGSGDALSLSPSGDGPPASSDGPAAAREAQVR